MAISYITTDLECDSERNLSALAAEFGNSIIIHLNDWVGDVYRVSVGLADTDTTAADAVSFYCSLLEKLTGESKALWEGCTRRVVDIAFEGGTEQESQTFQLPEAAVRQAATLGLSIAITIYRVGAYSEPKP
jgi:hypothetical protein